MSDDGGMGAGMLRMFRENAAQHFVVSRATWGICVDNRYSTPVLCFAVETEEQESAFPDEDGWPHQPAWHLDVWARGLNAALPQAGCEFRILDPFDDFTGVIFTSFYYDEHEGTTENVIRVIQREDELLDVSIEGHIRHNFASMPPTRITVDARFTRLSPHKTFDGIFNRGPLPPHDPPCGATFTTEGGR
jgi:hypothetical protein